MKRTIIPIIAILLFASCGKEPPMPKPNTYLRLSVPQPKYHHYDDKNLPFTFDYPDYGEIVPVKSDDKSSIWFNIVFERYGFEANVIPGHRRELDLTPLMRDTVLLTIPLMHVHPEGACNAQMLNKLQQMRAVNLTDEQLYAVEPDLETTNPSSGSIDPRWEALKKLTDNN